MTNALRAEGMERAGEAPDVKVEAPRAKCVACVAGYPVDKDGMHRDDQGRPISTCWARKYYDDAKPATSMTEPELLTEIDDACFEEWFSTAPIGDNLRATAKLAWDASRTAQK